MRAFTLLLLLLAACSSGGGGTSTIEVEPYLRQLDPNAVVIAWVTAEPEIGDVECDGHLEPFAVPTGDTATRNHEFRIDGLEPDTVYTYRVVGRPESHEFRTPKADGGPFTFAVIGDPGGGGGPQFDVIAVLERSAPEFVLTTGDNAYEEGRPEEVVAHYFVPFAELMARIPFYPSLGNHDLMTDNGEPFLTLAGIERYYAVRHGNALFLCLDSNQEMGPGSAQHAWLVSELASNVSDWTILYFHHPPYSSGNYGSDLEVRAALAPVFADHRIDVVFSAHAHSYERTVPIQGTSYVVTGGGGGGHLAGVGSSWFTAHSESVRHFVSVTIDGLSLSLEARDTSDRVFDSLTLTKSR